MAMRSWRVSLPLRWQHRGLKSGGGNHRGSIFRLLVGQALSCRGRAPPIGKDLLQLDRIAADPERGSIDFASQNDVARFGLWRQEFERLGDLIIDIDGLLFQGNFLDEASQAPHDV
jgi:hypothetical protein